MVVLSPIIGLLVDHYHCTARRIFLYVAYTNLSLPLAYLILLLGYTNKYKTANDDPDAAGIAYHIIHPVIPMLILGAGYACTNTLFWSNILNTTSVELFSFSSGVIACALNILPSILPIVVTYVYLNIVHIEESTCQLIALSILGFLTCFFSAVGYTLCEYTNSGFGSSSQREDDRSEGGTSEGVTAAKIGGKSRGSTSRYRSSVMSGVSDGKSAVSRHAFTVVRDSDDEEEEEMEEVRV